MVYIGLRSVWVYPHVFCEPASHYVKYFKHYFVSSSASNPNFNRIKIKVRIENFDVKIIGQNAKWWLVDKQTILGLCLWGELCLP